MNNHDISFFLDPRSVAVIGASTRSGTWGNRIASGLIDSGYAGGLYLVNPSAKELFGMPCYNGLEEVPGDVELAVMAIPAERLWQALESCALKGVRGVLIISSGFGESGDKGKLVERDMAAFCRRHNIRIIGPNVSGIYNLHAGFYATGGNLNRLRSSRMSFICQGGFAVHNVISHAYSKGIGIGKFIQTGNEVDLRCTDFLELLGEDPDTDALLLYIEGIKDPDRFMRLARGIVPQKPIVVFKGGMSPEGNRAAASHTGALAGSYEIYEGFFRQARCIQASRFETILELGRVLTCYPPLNGSRIGIITEGGSWGVMLTDQLSMHGFAVPELSGPLQETLRGAGMPSRASTRNPVDFGAGRGTLGVQEKVAIIEALLSCDELDGVVIHGYGTIGSEPGKTTPDWITRYQGQEEEVLRAGTSLMDRYGKPLICCAHASPSESRTLRELIPEGFHFFNRIEDIVEALSAMRRYQDYRDNDSEDG